MAPSEKIVRTSATGTCRTCGEESHELVDQGLITEADYRDFVFANPAPLWTSMNPDFLKGAVVEAAVAKLAA